MKNVFRKSTFVLLVGCAITSFGMEPHRRSASDVLGQQEDSKRQKPDYVEIGSHKYIVTIEPTLQYASINALSTMDSSVRPQQAKWQASTVPAVSQGSSVIVAANFNYQNQAHSSTQAVAPMPAIVTASNSGAKVKNYKEWTQETKNFVLRKLQENTPYCDIEKEWNKNPGNERISVISIGTFKKSFDPSLFLLAKEGSNKIKRCLWLNKHIDAGLAQGISGYKIAKAWKPEAGEPTITHQYISRYALKKNNTVAAATGQQIIDDSGSDDQGLDIALASKLEADTFQVIAPISLIPEEQIAPVIVMMLHNQINQNQELINQNQELISGLMEQLTPQIAQSSIYQSQAHHSQAISLISNGNDEDMADQTAGSASHATPLQAINQNEIRSSTQTLPATLFPLAEQRWGKIERCARLKNHVDAGLELGVSKYAIAKAWKPEAGEPTITHKAIGSYLLKKNNAAATSTGQQIVNDSTSNNEGFGNAQTVTSTVAVNPLFDQNHEEWANNALNIEDYEFNSQENK